MGHGPRGTRADPPGPTGAADRVIGYGKELGTTNTKGRTPKNRRSSRLWLAISGPATLLTLLGFFVAYQFVGPPPPKQFTIAAGSPDGAYYAFAQQYRQILARHGIDLRIRTTAGSVENLKLLQSGTGGPQVAFIQGGVADPEQAPGLAALGSLYFEPLWVFHRPGLAVAQLTDLKGSRVAVGRLGSGTRAVALQLLAANGIHSDDPGLIAVGGQEAADALVSGELDAGFFVVSARSPVTSKLLRSSAVELLSFDRGNAYRRRYPFLSMVTLPQGAVDLERNLPSQDVQLVAPATNLVVRDDFHPALIDLLLLAAAEVHGGGGLFEDLGQFPSPEYLDLPLHKEALRHFRSGPPFLLRYLPFWAATLADRLKVMLLPLLTLLIPLVKTVPPAYRWKVRSRIYRWYRELEAVDFEIDECRSARQLSNCAAELDRIETDVTQVSVPLSYAVELYDLRLHIDQVRKKLGRGKAGVAAPPASHLPRRQA